MDRVKCDRELLEKAQGFAEGSGNISEEQAMELWADAIDGGPIIDCEVRTLQPPGLIFVDVFCGRNTQKKHKEP